MSESRLEQIFKNIEKTTEYQYQSMVVDITEELCQLMEKQGVTKADLARKLGKSRAYVTKVLRGDNNLTLKTVVELFRTLGYKFQIKTEPLYNPQTSYTALSDMVLNLSASTVSYRNKQHKPVHLAPPSATSVKYEDNYVSAA